MYERFTDRARKVMQLANQVAQLWNHEYVGVEHVLVALEKEGHGVAAHVFSCLGIAQGAILSAVQALIDPGPIIVTMGKLPHTPRCKKVIDYACEEATKLGHDYVGTEHLLLGLIRETDGIAARALNNLNLTHDALRKMTLILLGKDHQFQAVPQQKEKSETKEVAWNVFVEMPPNRMTPEDVLNLARTRVTELTERIAKEQQELAEWKKVLGEGG